MGRHRAARCCEGGSEETQGWGRGRGWGRGWGHLSPSPLGHVPLPQRPLDNRRAPELGGGWRRKVFAAVNNAPRGRRAAKKAPGWDSPCLALAQPPQPQPRRLVCRGAPRTPRGCPAPCPALTVLPLMSPGRPQCTAIAGVLRAPARHAVTPKSTTTGGPSPKRAARDGLIPKPG